MKSFRKIEKIVGSARAKAGRVTDEQILNDAGVALSNISHNRPQALRPGPTIWRFIMESKITRYSAAAVIILAAALVLFSPFGTSHNGNIVLADVVDKVSEMSTIIIKEEYLFWEMDDDENILEADPDKLDVIKYVSEEYGVVFDVFSRIKLFNSGMERSGFKDSNVAASAVTCGAAYDVPSILPV